MFPMTYQLHRGARKEIRDSMSRVPLFFVVFFFTIFSIEIYSILIPLSVAVGFAIYLAVYYRQFLRFVFKNWILLPFPAIVLLSALWSNTPGQSFYYGLQLCITIAAGILMGILTTQRQLILGTFIAAAIVTVASILSGRMGPSAVGPVLIGVTGSKDQMGFAGMTLLASGMGVLFDRENALMPRLLAFLLLPVGAYIATHVESATPMIGTIGLIVVFPALFTLRYFTKKTRWILVILALVLIPPLSVVVTSEIPADANQKILMELGKDETLTGRTIIWDKADHWIQNSPVIGYGYRSFWLGSSADVIALLEQFGVTDPRTFQFHNTFREMLVDTGWVGLLALLGTTVFFTVCIISEVFDNPGASSALITSMFLFLISRSWLETIILAFYPYTALFYAFGASSVVYFMRKKLDVSSSKSACQTAAVTSSKTAILDPFGHLQS
jgi:exopolysaccharide production protein ExoQ